MILARAAHIANPVVDFVRAAWKSAAGGATPFREWICFLADWTDDGFAMGSVEFDLIALPETKALPDLHGNRNLPFAGQGGSVRHSLRGLLTQR
jgi:hypothetical protein